MPTSVANGNLCNSIMETRDTKKKKFWQICHAHTIIRILLIVVAILLNRNVVQKHEDEKNVKYKCFSTETQRK